jgi:Bacterial archaeo-eukaryotic release factor family 3
LSLPEYLKVISLHSAVDDLVIVADRFHTKPLRKYLQSLDRYHVLGVSLSKIRLFEGNRHVISEVVLATEIPANLSEALGYDLTDQQSNISSFNEAGAGGHVSMHHGDGGKKDLIDNDIEKFFRIIASEIYERYSKTSGLPLILAALPEHHHIFHQVSKNPNLLENGITLHPDSIKIDKLRELAWKILEPNYLSRIQNLINQFNQANANKTGSDDLNVVAQAAAIGRIETILIESDKIISGHIIDVASGAIELDSLDQPEIDDLLDDIGELAANNGAEVVVVPIASMPTETGIAAVFRY